MQPKTLVINERSNASLLVLAVVFGILTVAMEMKFFGSVKMPGHRAFPGALALLMFAQAFAPLALLGFAGAVSAVLWATGYFEPYMIGAWCTAAVAIIALGRFSFARSVYYFAACGVLFGLLRYLALFHGFNHTPEIIRLSGHLGFGAVGGLLAFGIHRGLKGKNEKNAI